MATMWCDMWPFSSTWLVLPSKKQHCDIVQRPRQSQFCVSYRIFCFFAPATLSIAWLMVSDCTLLASDFLGLPPLERGLAAGFWVALALAFAFAAFVASAFVLALFAGGSSPSYAELFRPNHSTKSERFALHSMKKNYYIYQHRIHRKNLLLKYCST